MAIDILLVDDQILILETIKTILEPEPEIRIVGTAQDGRSAIALVKELRPDILLIDIEMPTMNGIAATKYICKYLPQTKVIVLTSHKDQDYLAAALLAGAAGYLLKESLIQDIKREIYAFGRGYPSAKARFWSPAPKSSATNGVKYREKIVYFKQYRKNIYKPTVRQTRHQLLAKTASSQVAKPYCTTAGSSPRSKSPTANKISRTKRQVYSYQIIDRRSSKSRRRLDRRIIWLLLMISTLLFAIALA